MHFVKSSKSNFQRERDMWNEICIVIKANKDRVFNDIATLCIMVMKSFIIR